MERATVQGRLRDAGSLLIMLVVAIVLLQAAHDVHGLMAAIRSWLPHPVSDWVSGPGAELICRVVLLGLAFIVLLRLTHHIVRRVRVLALPYLGQAGAQALGTGAAIVAYAIIAALLSYAMGIELNGLSVPGAVTGVIIGIAAQASLGNLINGLVILFTRPYVEGMTITARSPNLVGGEYSGTVRHIGLLYTTMHVGDREVRLPNSAMAQSTVIVRTAEIEVYLPVVLAPTTSYEKAVAALRTALVEALPPRRTVSIVLEHIDAAGYAVGVHASVATLAEQETLAAVVARSVAGMITVPLPPPAPPAAQTAQPAADPVAPANAPSAARGPTPPVDR